MNDRTKVFASPVARGIASCMVLVTASACSSKSSGSTNQQAVGYGMARDVCASVEYLPVLGYSVNYTAWATIPFHVQEAGQAVAKNQRWEPIETAMQTLNDEWLGAGSPRRGKEPAPLKEAAVELGETCKRLNVATGPEG